MNKKWSYLLSYAFPWLAMLSIEKTGIALATFILQLTVIGWIPASLWARAEMKKHIEALSSSETKEDEGNDNSQEIIKSSQSISNKAKTAATVKKPKASTTKKSSSSSKTKAKPKASP